MEVRDLGFIEWKDPLAWMEPMKGDRWMKAVAAEKKHFARSAKTLINDAELNTIYKELLYARRTDLQQPLILYSQVAVVMDGSYFLEWKWLCTEHRIPAINLTADVNGQQYTQSKNGGATVVPWNGFEQGGTINMTFDPA
jgi:hypothetical protein